MLRLLFLGDIVGRAGRRIVADQLPGLRREFSPDLVIANGENAAGGVGLDGRCLQELRSAGVDVLTTGNHIWNRREIFGQLSDPGSRVLRPHNYPQGNPGGGVLRVPLPGGATVVVVNLIGRVFMGDLVDCPFRCAREIAARERGPQTVIFVDFHAEATSEKYALAYALDGEVAAVIGTHTHVQTADEQILPRGAAFLCDAGMCGPLESVIGVKPEMVVEKFTLGRAVRFDAAKGRAMLNGVVITMDETTGCATAIERVRRVEETAAAAAV